MTMPRSKRTVRTACPLNCWDTCTWLVEAAGRRVLTVRGDPDHPITQGFVCPKAQYQVERHHSPRRLRTPLLRNGERWQTIGWDAAIDELAERLDRARGKEGSLSILSYWDAGAMGLLKQLDLRFWNLFGPISVPTGSLCWSAGLAAQQADFGGNLAHDPTDHAASNFILIWGRNPIDTNVHLWPFLRPARERGARMVVVDPVATATARQADLHISPRPGSDLALALAMGCVIVDEDLVDAEYVGSHVRGFEDYCRLCRQFPPEQVEAKTGVGAGVIRELAREYARSRPATILMGYGLQRYAWGGAAVRAIDALAAITGNVGVAGGGANYASTFISSSFADLTGQAERKPRHRPVPRPKLAQHLQELDDPPITTAVVARSNPVAQLPNTGRTLEAFRSLDFLAVIDFTLTDTAELADLVLPATTVFEETDVYFCSWHNYLTGAEPAVDPEPGCRSDLEIYAALATRLGLGEAFGSHWTPREWIEEALQPLAAWGITAERLLGQSLRHPGAPLVAWQDGRFLTPSGKVELLGPGFSPPPSPQVDERYPFRLVTPQHRRTIHSQFYERVQEALGVPEEGPPAVLINDRLASKLGLFAGERVCAVSPWGRLVCQVRPVPGLNPDTLVIYSGGRVGRTCANVLTPDRLTDIGLGAAYYECPCRLERESVMARGGEREHEPA